VWETAHPSGLLPASYTKSQALLVPHSVALTNSCHAKSSDTGVPIQALKTIDTCIWTTNAAMPTALAHCWVTYFRRYLAPLPTGLGVSRRRLGEGQTGLLPFNAERLLLPIDGYNCQS
jgi:hypothetical protein